MISYELKFLTSDDTVDIKNIDLKASKYESKKKHNDSVYDVAKKSYLERRGGRVRAPRPRVLRELESKLRDRSVILCEWASDSLVTIVFSTGTIAYLSLNPNSLDINQILFDRYCVGKLSGQTLTGVVLCKSHLLFTHAECSATLVALGAAKTAQNPFLTRIADRNPHVQTIELSDGARRADRKVSWSEHSGRGPRILVWTEAGAEPAPWSPAPDMRANLHLYQLIGSQMNVLAYHQMENETLSAEISRHNYNLIHVVEQTTCQKNGVTLEWNQYEVEDSEEGVLRLSSRRTSVTRVSLPAAARATSRAECGTKLLVACIDGTLHVVHHAAGITHSTRAGFIPSTVWWAGSVAVCAEDGARLQCFDLALALLHHAAKCIHLQGYTSENAHMSILATRSLKTGSLILTTLGSGRTLALLRLTHPNVPLSWIRSNRLSRAVSVLRAMDWDTQGDECLFVLQRIAREVFRRPLSATSESALQSALGSYLAPLSPLRAATKYRAVVTDLARKFFHHLLRRGRLDKAMSLAVDVGAWDLFCDAKWMAERNGRHTLAEEGRVAADEAADAQITDSECSSSCSCSSHSSSSRETKPPPLPRLPPPPPPPLLPVPIHQPEQTSTNSIRPNLHQYLERDGTIWNTEVREGRPNLQYLERDGTIWNTEVREERPIRWHSMDDVLSDGNIVRHRSLTTIDEQPWNLEPKLYKRELNVPYRYQVSYPASVDRIKTLPDRSRQEKNVKFSDTVTINVVSEPPQGPVPARELADSLPLCAPHAYLAAFEPATTPAPGTTDYVEV